MVKLQDEQLLGFCVASSTHLDSGLCQVSTFVVGSESERNMAIFQLLFDMVFRSSSGLDMYYLVSSSLTSVVKTRACEEYREPFC